MPISFQYYLPVHFNFSLKESVISNQAGSNDSVIDSVIFFWKLKMIREFNLVFHTVKVPVLTYLLTFWFGIFSHFWGSEIANKVFNSLKMAAPAPQHGYRMVYTGSPVTSVWDPYWYSIESGSSQKSQFGSGSGRPWIRFRILAIWK